MFQGHPAGRLGGGGGGGRVGRGRSGYDVDLMSCRGWKKEKKMGGGGGA